MSDSFKNGLKSVLAAFVRHALTALGAWLLTKGQISKDQVVIINGWTDGIVGALILFGGVAWSWWRTTGFKQAIVLLKAHVGPSAVSEILADESVSNKVAKAIGQPDKAA